MGSFRFPAAMAVLAGASASLAQWSADPAANLAIGDRSGDHVQAKVARTTDGGCYISWFDNSTGGYDVYLQRLDVNGVEQWAHNGVLLADRTVSSTQDYDLVVDADGNALVSFNDTRSGSSQITLTKVDPAGVQLWGDLGVTLSTGASFKGPPQTAVLSDGNIAVAWGQDSMWVARRVSPAGSLLGAQLDVAETGHSLGLCDVQAGDNGTFITLWTRSFTSSGLSSKYLYTQKYDANNAALWAPTGTATAVEVYAPQPSTPWPGGGGTYGTQGGAVQNGYFPSFIADGQGGAVYGWYEIAGPRNAYLQHVLPDGSFKFAANGITNAVTGTNRIRISGGLAYHAPTGEYFLASTESSSPTQGNYSVFVQKYAADGSRLWGDTGVTIIAPNANQSSFVQCQPTGDGGCMVFGIDSRSALTHVVFAAGVDGEGTMNWSNLASSTIESKSRLTSTTSTHGFAILAFGGGASGGSSNVYAQNVNPDGSFGPIAPACDPDINCDGVPDQGDVACMILAVAGELSCFCQTDPDFNHDGVPDQGDVAAVILTVAGAPCE